MNNITSYQPRNNVCIIDIRLDNVQSTEHILFTSDEHIDSQYCNRTALKNDLELIKSLNGGWVSIGDMFDVMGHNADPRSTKSDIKNTLKDSRYYNKVLEDVSEFIEPYKDRLLMLTEGNHEYNVHKRHEFDMLSAVRYYMNKIDQILMPYSGWIRLRIFKNTEKTAFKTITIRYTHGISKTKFLKLNQNYLADVYMQGHLHQSKHEPFIRLELDRTNTEVKQEIEFIQLSTYKEEESGYYSMSKGYPSAPIGGVLLKIEMKADKNKKYRPILTFTKLKHY